jgi:hypothetical protein
MSDFCTSGGSASNRAERAAFRESRSAKRLAVWSLASAAILAHALTAETASAQSPSTNRVLAEALFREGRELMDAGNVPEACAKFAESYRLDRALGTLLNLALCHEKEGKTATAWSEFSDAASEAAAEKDDREAFAKKHATALGSDLPRVQLSVAEPTRGLASLEIQIDKSTLGRSAWTSTIPLDPGDHEVAATAEGKKPFRATFTVPKGASLTPVSVPPLENAPVVVAPPSNTTSPHPAATSDGGTQRFVGYVLGGLGLAGAGVGAAFGLRAMSLKDDRDAACDANHVCNPAGVRKDSDARDAALVSTIGFVGGAALLTGGIVLVLTAPRSNSVRVGTTGRELFVGGTF